MLACVETHLIEMEALKDTWGWIERVSRRSKYLGLCFRCRTPLEDAVSRGFKVDTTIIHDS